MRGEFTARDSFQSQPDPRCAGVLEENHTAESVLSGVELLDSDSAADAQVSQVSALWLSQFV